MLSEKEAWLEIAERWSRATPEQMPGDSCLKYRVETNVVERRAAVGLCASIVDLLDSGKIDKRTYYTMIRHRLDAYREVSNKHGLYIWSFTKDGALARVEFCKTQAENPID